MGKHKTKKNPADSYPKVLAMVKEGKTIKRALKDLKVGGTPFYNAISEEQKAALRMARSALLTFPKAKHIFIASAEMENLLINDAQKHKREYKRHLEWIIEQYAAGNMQINVGGQWMPINPLV